MLRSGSSSRRYWALVIAGPLLIVIANASADEPVICPSSANNLTRPATGVGGAPHIGTSATRIGAGAPFDITSDAATLGVGGDTILQGNVQVLQGDRELRANHAHYDPTHHSMELEGSVEYTDSLMHVTGVGGNYTQNEGADFSAAQFELHQPPAHGSADVMHLTPDGKIRLDHVRFTTCPKEDTVWELRANEIILDTHARVGIARSTKVEFDGVPVL